MPRDPSTPPTSSAARPSVATGLDRLANDAELRRRLAGKRVGLLAHAASVDRNLQHACDLVGALCKLRVLFAPEHGFTAAAQDMDHIKEETKDGLRVVSLYGEWPEQLAPSPDDLADLDLVIIDLQDVGSRYYTYVWTAAFMLRVCARVGVKVLVLDRPNPLGGIITEGAPQGAMYRSFVGVYQVPIRHGLTYGEMLHFVQKKEKLDEDALEIVTMEGWRREMFFEDTGLPWVMPSPNMPTPDTAFVYPGGCLVEGTTLSEGRGTTRPFELIGAPGVDGAELAKRISAPGATLRPTQFVPTTRKHAGVTCGGVQVHVRNRHEFRSVDLYLRLIAEMTMLRDEAGRLAPWRTEPYEYERYRPAMDLLAGDCIYRQLVNDRLVRGHGPDALEDYFRDHAARAAEFDGSPYHLYR